MRVIPKQYHQIGLPILTSSRKRLLGERVKDVASKVFDYFNAFQIQLLVSTLAVGSVTALFKWTAAPSVVKVSACCLALLPLLSTAWALYSQYSFERRINLVIDALGGYEKLNEIPCCGSSISLDSEQVPTYDVIDKRPLLRGLDNRGRPVLFLYLFPDDPLSDKKAHRAVFYHDGRQWKGNSLFEGNTFQTNVWTIRGLVSRTMIVNGFKLALGNES